MAGLRRPVRCVRRSCRSDRAHALVQGAHRLSPAAGRVSVRVTTARGQIRHRIARERPAGPQSVRETRCGVPFRPALAGPRPDAGGGTITVDGEVISKDGKFVFDGWPGNE